MTVPAIDYAHDLDGFLKKITSKTKLIFVANPNNPTGTLIDKPLLLNFLEKVPDHILVVLDEAYEEYLDENLRSGSFKWLNKFKNLENKFKNSEFIFLLIYRLVGGVPWQLSCILPTLFNVKIKNYFFATVIGLTPGIFLIASIGSGLEKIIDQNTEIPGISDIIFSSDIYIPVLSFLVLILVTIIFRKFFIRE